MKGHTTLTIIAILIVGCVGGYFLVHHDINIGERNAMKNTPRDRDALGAPRISDNEDANATEFQRGQLPQPQDIQPQDSDASSETLMIGPRRPFQPPEMLAYA